MRNAFMISRGWEFAVAMIYLAVALVGLGVASAEVSSWRMKDGRVLSLELRAAWGEDDAAMVEFITRDMKILTLKRNELNPEDQKKIPEDRPRREAFRFTWATARPERGDKDTVTIIYSFERSLPGVVGFEESTLKVAPFQIGSVTIAPEAWKLTVQPGVDGVLIEFRTTGKYDVTKLTGAKFSASVELEVGKNLRRTIQKIDFPQRPLQEVKVRTGEFEITSVHAPALGEAPARYGVLVRTEPKEKMIRYLMESNGRTAGLGGMETSVAGTFATVKIDYWESFEKKVVQFAGTAGQPDPR
jgi:hypothetical protein